MGELVDHLKSMKMELKIAITFAVIGILCGIDAKSITSDSDNLAVDDFLSENTELVAEYDKNLEKDTNVDELFEEQDAENNEEQDDEEGENTDGNDEAEDNEDEEDESDEEEDDSGNDDDDGDDDDKD